MRTTSLCVMVSIALLACVVAAPVQGEDQKTKVQGLITGRTGDTLTVKTGTGSVTVVLTDDTKVQKPKGLGLRKTQMSFSALIPGLKVSVDAIPAEEGRVVAKTITFSGDDLKTAEAIQAGLDPTKQAVETNKQDIGANKVQIAANQERIGANEQQIAANQKDIQEAAQRFSDLTEFDTKGEANVYFASGSKKISDKDKSALAELARNASSLTGYLIEVKGYADSSGNAAINQRLSMDRAQEVVAYLIQDCNVPVRRVVAPGAMGSTAPIATNETASGRSQNRRVEVKVLVNRGLAGGQ